MKKGKVILGIIAVVAVIAIFFASTYNSLLGAETTVDKSWADVQTNYQRRADLIANLVGTVKGAAAHESETFEKIAGLRSGYLNAKTPGELSALDQQLRASINVAVEAYPELKANENFLSLQDELAGTENRIAVARRDYNEVAANFNLKIRRFPTNIFAKILGFQPRDLFQADAAAQTAPTVDFGKK